MIAFIKYDCLLEEIQKLNTLLEFRKIQEGCQMNAQQKEIISIFVCLFVFLRYAGLSLPWPLLLRSTGPGSAGPMAMAHGPSRSAACGFFPDRGTNPCPLHRQADSQPLRHQGSPEAWL